MTNNPLINYKPDVFLSTPVSVTMAAADWIAFMTWLSGQTNIDGVSHLIYGMISPQITEAIYSAASMRAAEAAAHEAHESHPLHQIIQAMSGQQSLRPEDFTEGDDGPNA